MAKIPFKEFLIGVDADDGTILKGVIYYWDKDYSVRLLEPVKSKAYGAHLMYMIPVTYIVNTSMEDNSIVENGKHYINIYNKCRKKLKKLY